MVLSCLDAEETVVGVFNKPCLVAGERRTSPLYIVTILPLLGGFGSGEGFNTFIIIHSNVQPSLDR